MHSVKRINANSERRIACLWIDRINVVHSTFSLTSHGMFCRYPYLRSWHKYARIISMDVSFIKCIFVTACIILSVCAFDRVDREWTCWQYQLQFVACCSWMQIWHPRLECVSCVVQDLSRFLIVCVSSCDSALPHVQYDWIGVIQLTIPAPKGRRSRALCPDCRTGNGLRLLTYGHDYAFAQ